MDECTSARKTATLEDAVRPITSNAAAGKTSLMPGMLGILAMMAGGSDIGFHRRSDEKPKRKVRSAVVAKRRAANKASRKARRNGR